MLHTGGKGIEGYHKAQMLVYKKKDKGQWHLYRHMKRDAATPLVAVRRKQRGSRGQQVGTIATSPKEVDSIMRNEYGAIYKGNGKKGGRPGSVC